MTLENNGPSPEEINLKGYFTLEDLHEITPLYCIKESIETDEGVIISPNDVVKYLGLFIDNRLNFNYHTNIVISKISRMIGNFWRAEFIDMMTKNNLPLFSGIVSQLWYSHMVCRIFQKPND